MKHFFNNKNVLIFGGMGFIGSNLSIELVNLGAKVTIVDCLLPEHGGNLFNIHSIQDKVELYFTDIRDTASIELLLKSRKYDMVYTIAAHSSHLESVKYPIYDLEINCKGVLNILEALKEFSPTTKVVYIGTRAQYGKTEESLVSEEHSMAPLEQYAAHKMLAERYHLIYHSLYNLPVTCIRMNNVYGPRSQMKHPKFGVMNWFIRLAMENKEITIHGDGSQKRDYNYISDVVEALLIVGESDESVGKVFNLGSGEGTEFRKIVENIVEIVGTGEITYIDFPSENKRIDVGSFTADISKIKKLGWNPTVTFQSGIEETVSYYKKYMKHYW